MNDFVLGVGDAMVDMTTQASELPPRGGNIWSTAVIISPGGTTANVAANLARLGISSSFMGSIGGDPYGQYVIDDFQNNGVDISRVIRRMESFTGIVLAIIDDEGERTFIACARGAAHTKLYPDDLKGMDFTALPIIHTSGVCLVEEPSRAALLNFLELSHSAGSIVYYDPNLRLEGNYFPPDLYDAQMHAISQADIVLIGAEEINLFFGEVSNREAVKQLHSLGPQMIVIKQGEMGASLYYNDTEVSCPAFQVPVANTAGAGDAFDAGFIAAQQRGLNIHDSLIYACTVAAIKVTRQGSRAVPDHKEVMKFLANRSISLRSH